MAASVEVFHSRREHRHAVFWKFSPLDAGVDVGQHLVGMHKRCPAGYSKMTFSVGNGIGYLAHAPEEFVQEIVQVLAVVKIQSEARIPMWLMRVVMREVDALHLECPHDHPRWQQGTLDSVLSQRVSATRQPTRN